MPAIYMGSATVKEAQARFRAALVPSQQELDRSLTKEFGGSAVRFLPVHSALAKHPFDREGRPILIDNTHLSAVAARELVQTLQLSF